MPCTFSCQLPRAVRTTTERQPRFAPAPQHRQSVDSRQPEIEHHGVVALGLRRESRPARRPRRGRRHSRRRQAPRQLLGQQRLVFDDQHSHDSCRYSAGDAERHLNVGTALVAPCPCRGSPTGDCPLFIVNLCGKVRDLTAIFAAGSTLRRLTANGYNRAPMKRALVLSLGTLAAAGSVAILGRQSTPGPAAAPFRVYETSIADLQAAMASGRTTSREIVSQYLMRLGIYEDRLNAAIAVNPHALDEADALDRERAQGKVRGPLHGIPVALKDNIHTTHLPTTGGALAFARLYAAVRGDADEEPARRRRDHHRQGRADRARQLGRRRARPDAGQLQRGRRLRLQSLRSAARSARRRPSTAGRRCRPAARARASAPPPASGRPASAPTPAAR